MKNKLLFIFGLFLSLTIVFVSCKKEKSAPESIPQPLRYVYGIGTSAGLGSNPGLPSGTQFHLPSYVKIIGEIRGGLPGQKFANKQTYSGLFPINESVKSWVDYGTGTYVNLYVAFYNTLATPATLTLPGGLIFIDSTDVNDSLPIYQKGLILQDVNIALPAQDTAFACLRAYCLNLHGSPSNYSAVYFIGPVTNNAELNQIVTIMHPKQYPFGEESNIQSIIWHVTDDSLTLTTTEIQYLNSLP